MTQTGASWFCAWGKAEQKRFGGPSWVCSCPGGRWWVPGTCQAQWVLDTSLNSPDSTMRAGLVLFPTLRVGKPRLSELR